MKTLLLAGVAAIGLMFASSAQAQEYRGHRGQGYGDSRYSGGYGHGQNYGHGNYDGGRGYSHNRGGSYCPPPVVYHRPVYQEPVYHYRPACPPPVVYCRPPVYYSRPSYGCQGW